MRADAAAEATRSAPPSPGALGLDAIPCIPEIRRGDDLARILGDALAEAGGLRRGDVLALAHKVVSKAEGALVDMTGVAPGAKARALAEELGKDPRKVEVVLGESARIVRTFRRPGQPEGTIICEHRLGHISANAGVDESNARGGTLILLPHDPDASARALGQALEARFGGPLGVVITDTFGRPWRLGQVNVAIGLWRVPALASEIGRCDAWGRPLRVTEPALADEIAAATGLVVRKAAQTPLVRLRGLDWTPEEHASAQGLLRRKEEDAFR